MSGPRRVTPLVIVPHRGPPIVVPQPLVAPY